MENETVQRLKELFEAYSRAYNDNIMLGITPNSSVQIQYEHRKNITTDLAWTVEEFVCGEPYHKVAKVIVDGLNFHMLMDNHEFDDFMLQRAKALELEAKIAVDAIYPMFIENWVKPQQVLEEIKNQHPTDPTADNEIFGTGGK